MDNAEVSAKANIRLFLLLTNKVEAHHVNINGAAISFKIFYLCPFRL